MIALDTNVVVRILVNDDPGQAKRAVALLESDAVFLPRTVLLETEWVLRYAYDLDRAVAGVALRKFLGLKNVVAEASTSVVAALDLYDAGMDFADALHLTASGGAESFASFDADLARHAKQLGARPPVRCP